MRECPPCDDTAGGLTVPATCSPSNVDKVQSSDSPHIASRRQTTGQQVEIFNIIHFYTSWTLINEDFLLLKSWLSVVRYKRPHKGLILALRLFDKNKN